MPVSVLQVLSVFKSSIGRVIAHALANGVWPPSPGLNPMTLREIRGGRIVTGLVPSPNS
jgi:hypothetical protein